MMTQRFNAPLRACYDFIICGGGTAGCVIARRLAEHADVTVLLIEAGGSDQVEAVMDTTQWMSNIGSERDWGYRAEPSDSLNGRTPVLPMGKVLGGGSSINGSIWARGHRHDYDGWAQAVDDNQWNYHSALAVFRQIEDWHGPQDTHRRGQGGLLSVRPPTNPVPLVDALLQAATRLGVPAVNDINAAAMEGDAACGLANILVQDGNRRVSMAASYLHPVLGASNLDVLLCAEVTGLTFSGKRVTGVELVQLGKQKSVSASQEVIVSLGAINTPRLLMTSGIGPESSLREHNIQLRQSLPGVGQNFHDHILLAGCCWEYLTPEAPRNNAAEFVFFSKSRADLPAPDLMPVLEETPFASEVIAQQFDVPIGASSAWTLAPGLAQPKSRGQISLASADPRAPAIVEANFMQDPEDMRAMLTCVELCRDIGNSPECAPYRKREVFPGSLNRSEMTNFIRNAAGTYFHQCGTAKMGRDEMAVVDAQLRVYGLEGLRVADASIMPTIATGNTMAPTVFIAERAATLISQAHGLSRRS
ncbi:MAG: GMC family oxidoreductase [Burkholderiaceae bacterium]